MPGKCVFHVCVLVALLGAVGCESYEYCPPGLDWCWAKCVDLMADVKHCGRCDNRCGAQADCVGGRCECVPGYIECGGKCLDPSFDNENCGMCGNRCLGSAECVNGGCVPGERCEDLYPGLITCGDECVDPDTDENHCGACDNVCRADQVCRSGRCSCFGSAVECGDRCVDLSEDHENCGACGRRCAPNQVCSQGQCSNVESSQLGDPCPYGDVNATANYCAEGLECLGIPADGNAGTCPGGEPGECTALIDLWNRDCVNGNCGASFCSQECDYCRECPEGFDPMDAGSPARCMCVPNYHGMPIADPCPWNGVNAEHDDCLAGNACLGNGNMGACPSGCVEDCSHIPCNYHPDCVDQVCGFSFCAFECDAEGNCMQGFEPADVSGTCYCIPANPGDAQAGDPCPLNEFNASADQCDVFLTCLGNEEAGYCPGGNPMECTGIPDAYNTDCVNGICGYSFCSARCDEQGSCPQGFRAQDEEAICYCVPE